MRRSVEFATEDGTLLRGQVHAGASAAPRIVMRHGFGGVRSQPSPPGPGSKIICSGRGSATLSRILNTTSN